MTKKVHQQNFPLNKWTNFSQDSYAFLQLGIRLALLVFIVHPPFDVCKGLFFIFLYVQLSGTTGFNRYVLVLQMYIVGF